VLFEQKQEKYRIAENNEKTKGPVPLPPIFMTLTWA